MKFQLKQSALWVASALAVILAANPLSAATQFPDVIPQDAIFGIYINDVSAVKSAWNKSPLAKAYDDPEFAATRTFIEDRWKEIREDIFEDSILNEEDVKKILKGGVAVWSTATAEQLEEDEDQFVVVIETDEEGMALFRKDFEEEQKNLPTSAKKSTYDFLETKIYVVEYIEEEEEEASADEPLEPTPHIDTGKLVSEAYAFMDQHFVVVSPADDSIKEAIANLKTPGSRPSVKTLDAFKTFEKEVPSTQNQIRAFLNLAPILANAAVEAPQFETLGMTDFGYAFSSASLGEAGIEFDAAVTVAPQKKGITEILYAGKTNPLSTISYVPSDALSFGSFTLDLQKIYQIAMQMYQSVDPAAMGQKDMVKNMIMAQYGIDLENDLIYKIKGEHLVYSRELPQEIAEQLPPEIAVAQSSTAFILNLEDGQAVVASVKALLDKLANDPNMPVTGFLDIEEIDGFPVISPKEMPIPNAPKPSLAFTSKAIVFANNKTELREAIRQMNAATSSIKEEAEVAALLQKVDTTNLRAFTYTASEAYGNSIESIKTMMRMSGETEIEGFSIEDLPPSTFFEKYLGSSWGTLHMQEQIVIYRTHLPSAGE